MKGSAFAVLTPPGRGGIAVIRATGPAVEPALGRCFRPSARAAALPPTGSLAYGHITDDGRPLDEVILYRDGDAAFEINCHGGPAAVAAVCARLEALGLERVDADRLLELEGAGRVQRDVRRLLRRATTPLAARILLDQLDGALNEAVARIRTDLASQRVAAARDRIDLLLQRWARCGRFLADPPRIVVAGRPNAGKSTLLNRLLGAERAITAPAPGTTRDYVEADGALSGLPVVLVDTAGLRQARETIERLGIDRAQEQAARAAAVVYLLDAGEGAVAEDEAMLASLGNRALAVWNKADLAKTPRGAPGVLAVSALTGEGMDALTAAILERLDYRAAEPGDAVPVTGDQAGALERARDRLAEARVDEARGALDWLAADGA